MSFYGPNGGTIPGGNLVRRAGAMARALPGRFLAARALPAFDAETERLLAERARAGDADAAETLIRAHFPFVFRTARRYRHYGVPMSDLVQEGMIGLMQAIKRFDPAKGFRLCTYAAWWIRAQIQDCIVRSWSLVRLGTSTAQRMLFFHLRRLIAGLKDGAGALSEELVRPLADKFRVPLTETMNLARRLAGGDRSLDERAESGDRAPWSERLPDPAPTPEDHAVAASDRRHRKRLIVRALLALPRRERKIILARYLSGLAKTQEVLARELGLSAERVRQLEKKALGKLKMLLAPLQRQH